MRLLAERQQEFAAALLLQDLPLPKGLDGHGGPKMGDRFGVYRANVVVGLTEALRASFPVVNSLVGDEFFSAMAATFALGSPPRTPVLLSYGEEFPAFIARFEPAATLPYLPEVARLEWLWLQTYHAAEAETLSVRHLARIPPDCLPALQLDLHPACSFSLFSRSALSIWQVHQGTEHPADMEVTGDAEAVLLVRPHALVDVLPVTHGTMPLLQSLAAGGTIGDAVTLALEAEPDMDVGSILPLLFEVGAFSGLVRADCPDPSWGEVS